MSNRQHTKKWALREESEKIHANNSYTILLKYKYKYKSTQMHNWAAANTRDTANKGSCWDKLFTNKKMLNTVIYRNPQSYALRRTAHTNENCNAVCLELL